MLYDKKWDTQVEQPVLEPWQEALLGAISVINEKGWCQGDLINKNGVCVLGALYLSSDKSHKPQMILAHYLQLNNRSMLPVWNDAPGRTKEEVIAALEGAAFSK